jgi:hypothetical protein
VIANTLGVFISAVRNDGFNQDAILHFDKGNVAHIDLLIDNPIARPYKFLRRGESFSFFIKK